MESVSRLRRGLFWTTALLVLISIHKSGAQENDDVYMEDKRNVATLARNGDLPFIRQEWKKFVHPLTSAWQSGGTRGGEMDKRFVGSLARAGDLPGKRDLQDAAAEELLADALVREILADYLQQQELEEEALEEEASNALLDKRFVASIARSGVLPAGKRNIAAMARDGYLTQHRAFPSKDVPDSENETLDEEDGEALESLMDEVNKRHVGALARGFNMPYGLTSGGKRNVGALARTGGLSRFSANRYGLYEDKRTIASLLRGRLNGKRSPIRGQNLPFAYARLSGVRDFGGFEDPGKRNIQSFLKSLKPSDEFSSGHGKRHALFSEENKVNDAPRRYVAALMNSPARVLAQNAEQKRHLGSFLASKQQFTVQKKSTIPANKADSANDSPALSRSKREADEEMMNSAHLLRSGEYALPVLQGSDLFDYEDPAAFEEKRFLGSLARSGWMPSRQVRSPQMPEGGEEELGKRHIGALARLGWLPSVRSLRRYTRGAPEMEQPRFEGGSPIWVEPLETKKTVEEQEEHPVVDHVTTA